jgi:PAS domain S-box-containing protein
LPHGKIFTNEITGSNPQFHIKRWLQMKTAYPDIKNRRGNGNGVFGKTHRSDIAPPFPNNHVFFHLTKDNKSDPISSSGTSPAFKFDHVSPSATQITGYTPEDFYADPLLAKKCIPPKDFRRLSDLSVWMNPDKAKPMEIRWKRKDGRMLWTEHLISPVLDKDGNLVSLNVMFRDTTERKESEIALQESQQFNASLLENAPHAVMVINPDTSVKYVNPAWEKLNGWTLSEITGIKAPYPWWPDEFKDSFSAAFKEAVKQGSGNGEIISQKKNGEIYWISINWASVMNNGELLYLLINSVDITDRKRMEEALKESEEKFSKAFRSSPQIVAITTRKEGRFIDVNDSYTRYTGFTREEVLGRKSIDINVWLNDADRKRMFKLLKEKGRVNNEEFKFRTKSGDICTWLFSVEPITIRGEECLIGVATDISERKSIEEELQESEEKFSKAFYTSPHMMAIASLKDGKYTEVNDSYTRCLGYTREELVGHTADELNIWVKPEETKKIIAVMKKTGKIREAEHGVRTKHGQIRSWMCSGDTININGEPYMIAVATDITEQKAVEEKLQEHKKMMESILSTMPEGVLVIDKKQSILLANKAMHKIFDLNGRSLKNKTLADIFPREQFFNLHKSVKGRKADKQNLEFRYQVDGLDKIIDCVVVKMDGGRTLLCFADISREREEEEKLYLTDRLASIGEMAAGLAHELNNPLTGILALSQMLTHANLPSEYKEDMECINTEAKRAASIVKNVLLFARSQAGEISQSSINDVIKNVLKLREYEEKAGNITIVANLEENLPPVPLDKGQLQQVFLNLISNAEAAIKQIDRPGIITIATQRTNSHVSIMFSDNGCGINKQVIPRIFDPFFTTKEIGKGTGLGLSICYSIIVKHGGKINVKSQVNEGTTFTIKLPIVR